MASPLPRQAEIVIYDQQRRQLAAAGRALGNANQERIGLLVVFRDVTAPREKKSPLPPGEG
jgi:hypothetical protein